MRIDINSDMGESFGAYTLGHDAGLMQSITSANIAAGFHAGDPSVLRKTIRMAKEHGVAAIPISPFLSGVEPGPVLRFCFAKRDETLEAAAERLRKV